jgi:Na+-transporting NADH:ubiquinone oxidoreductase subunit C
LAENRPLNLWKRFLSLPNESRSKTFIVALLLALICSTGVSLVSVQLRPLQEANIEADRQARLDAMIAGLPALAAIVAETGADAIETRLVDLETGRIAPNVDPGSYNMREAAYDPDLSVALTGEEDFAGIGRRANLAPVFILSIAEEIRNVILPVNGSGYGGMIYAYLALERDFNTISSLAIIEHSETPGLGARITDDSWQALWQGKQIVNDVGELSIAVVQSGADGPFEVDGISGATRSSRGITNMLRFWLGPNGFEPFLRNLKEGEISL